MSSFALKITALILMLLDHIYQFLNFTSVIPIWFTWLESSFRADFYFCMAQGLTYTHSRKAYLLRMYLFSIAMSIGNLTLTTLLPNAPSGGNPKQYFASLYWVRQLLFAWKK